MIKHNNITTGLGLSYKSCNMIYSKIAFYNKVQYSLV